MAEPGLQAQGITSTPADSPELLAPQQPVKQVVHLNCSNFKPEFSGKPDEDADTYLLCTNDCMNAHHFTEGVKVQRFSLTLLGEAMLWYHSLEPINVNWQGLQNFLGNSTQR